jgi:hypothetical protein
MGGAAMCASGRRFADEFIIMSVIGSPLETSALQAIQAQHVASKARDKEKAQSASGRRFQDLVELRVAGLETADAVRPIPHNDSEQADTERDGQDQPTAKAKEDDRPRIDVKA